MPAKGQKYNRIDLKSERAENRISVWCKLPLSVHEKLQTVVEHDEKLNSVNDFLCKTITKAVRHRITRINNAKNETTRDRLLREINNG